jgi:hypothetical protein
MAKIDAPRLTIDDAEGRRLHAVWSRSGKRLGVSASETGWHGFRQVELRPDQVDQLIGFLAETGAEDMRDRGHRSRRFEDADEGCLDAVWSRSGSTLILAVWKPVHVLAGQVQVRPEQLPGLVEFLVGTSPTRPNLR